MLHRHLLVAAVPAGPIIVPDCARSGGVGAASSRFADGSVRGTGGVGDSNPHVGSKFVVGLVGALLSSVALADELRVGVVSERPVEMIQYYNPLVQYLAGGLKHLNISEGKVVVVRDLGDLLRRAQEKAVDIVFESAFSTVELQDKAGMLPKLLVWKKGGRDYRTVFFVRKDRGIRALDDFRGKVIAFESPNSTSAYVMPMAELLRLGYAVTPVELRAAGDAIRFVFARREVNQAFHVLQKKADGGAFSNNDWDELPPKAREELMIIHETASVVRFVVSFHPAVATSLQTAIEELLIQMDQSPAGRSALQAAGRAAKIEKLTDADLKSLDYVRSLRRALGP